MSWGFPSSRSALSKRPHWRSPSDCSGDYSQGAVGFWIEKGELTYPVHEITIAGNLKEMLLGIEMVGNDLSFRQSVVTPRYTGRDALLLCPGHRGCKLSDATPPRIV